MAQYLKNRSAILENNENIFVGIHDSLNNPLSEVLGVYHKQQSLWINIPKGY